MKCRAARWNTADGFDAVARATSSADRTSPLMNVKRGAPSRPAIASSLPREQSSMPITSAPCSSSWRTRTEPMNPAQPVTRTRRSGSDMADRKADAEPEFCVGKGRQRAGVRGGEVVPDTGELGMIAVRDVVEDQGAADFHPRPHGLEIGACTGLGVIAVNGDQIEVAIGVLAEECRQRFVRIT